MAHWESEDDRWRRYAPQGLPDDQCWNWQGHLIHKGYGLYMFAGSRTTAHRAALLRLGVEIPPGKIVCHHCDNRACVNPKHLYVGTHKSNSDDKWTRGRANPPRGSRHGRTKLSDPLVRQVRTRYATGETRAALAKEFAMSWTSIDRIVSGLQRANVEG